MGPVGGCLVPCWLTWQEWGAEDWVVQVLKDGYKVPFLSSPPLSSHPVHLPSYSPSSIRGKALATEVVALQEKGAVELAPPTLGFYSRIFVALRRGLGRNVSGPWPLQLPS